MKIGSEPIHYPGELVGIGQRYFVIVIDNTVSIYVTIFDISRTNAAESALVGTCVDFFFTGEEAFCNISAKDVKGFSGYTQIIIR